MLKIKKIINNIVRGENSTIKLLLNHCNFLKIIIKIIDDINY